MICVCILAQHTHAHTQVMLLCGADVLHSFTIPGVWENPDELLKEHGIACVVREGTDMDALMQHELLDR